MATKQNSTTVQVTRFGMVGVLNTVIDYTIYIGLTKIFSIPLDRVWVAKLVSGSVAIVNSFYFNRKYVFHGKRKNANQQFARFVVSTLIAVYVIQLGLVQFFTGVWTWPGELGYEIVAAIGLAGLLPGLFTQAFVIKTVAFGLAAAASMTWNFLLYKLWAFKE